MKVAFTGPQGYSHSEHKRLGLLTSWLGGGKPNLRKVALRCVWRSLPIFAESEEGSACSNATQAAGKPVPALNKQSRPVEGVSCWKNSIPRPYNSSDNSNNYNS